MKEYNLYRLIFGQSSVFYRIFGTFFNKINNTAGLIATLVVCTLIFITVYKMFNKMDFSYELNLFGNIIFLIVGFYFSKKNQKNVDEPAEEWFFRLRYLLFKRRIFPLSRPSVINITHIPQVCVNRTTQKIPNQ